MGYDFELCLSPEHAYAEFACKICHCLAENPSFTACDHGKILRRAPRTI